MFLGWYCKAAEQGLSQGQTALGLAYEHGWGVAKDKTQAINWYKKASEQGTEIAKNALTQLNDALIAKEQTEQDIKDSINGIVFFVRNLISFYWL